LVPAEPKSRVSEELVPEVDVHVYVTVPAPFVVIFAVILGQFTLPPELQVLTLYVTLVTANPMAGGRVLVGLVGVAAWTLICT